MILVLFFLINVGFLFLWGSKGVLYCKPSVYQLHISEQKSLPSEIILQGRQSKQVNCIVGGLACPIVACLILKSGEKNTVHNQS